MCFQDTNRNKVLFLITGQIHQTDYSNASGTGMWDPYLVSFATGFSLFTMTCITI